MINIKRTIPVFLAVLLISACISGTSVMPSQEPADKKELKQEAKQEVKPQNNSYEKAEITTKIIPSANKTFGYDILLYGRPLVHQPNIPGLPGNEGFTTRARAQKVADFVAKKIRKNEMPPTVTIEDLNNMGVLKAE
jgi:hypothetical protein